MNANIVPNSFVAISDFHSYEYPINKIKKYYLNEYDKIFILGDTTDRGENGYGENGVKFLLEIKKLTEKYPERVIYIPGNHDEFLYNYAKYGDKEGLYVNEAFDTINDIDNLKKENVFEFNDLINWLGKLPLQVRHSFNGKNYAFAHAFFNQSVYEKNPNFSLDDLARYNNQKTYNILWFRKTRNEFYDSFDVPCDAIMVIGHTPTFCREGVSLDLKNKYGEFTKVVCVDGGIAYGGEMLKFDGHDEAINTPVDTHTDTSFKKNDEAFDENDINIFNLAIIETVNNHGIENMKNILIGILNNLSDYATYFSRINREAARKLGLRKIKQILFSYRDEFCLTDENIAEKYLRNLYNSNIEFKMVVDAENEMIFPKNTPAFSDDLNQNVDEAVLEESKTYKIINENGLLVIIGDILEEQLFNVMEEIKNEYGEGAINSAVVFDYDTINSQIVEGTVSLGDFGYTATKDEFGNIIVRNSNGNVVFDFEKNINNKVNKAKRKIYM